MHYPDIVVYSFLKNNELIVDFLIGDGKNLEFPNCPNVRDNLALE